MPMLVPGFNLNHLRMSNEVSLHPQLMEYDVRTSDGANVGFNDRQTVAPGYDRKYRWYAGRVDVLPDGSRKATPIEYGAINLTDYGDIMKHGSHGAVGVIVIEPPGASWTTASNSNAEAEVKDAGGNLLFKEFVTVYQDDVDLIGPNGNPVRNYVGESDSEDSGSKAFNYRTEPLWARLGFINEMTKRDHNTFEDPIALMNDVDQSNVFSSNGFNPGCGGGCGDPATPVFNITPGTKARFRIVQPTGHPRQHAWTLHGHNWIHEPWVLNSTTIFRPGVDAEPASMTIGTQGGHAARRHWNVVLPSAGGAFKVTGDYLFRSQESFQVTGGLWGILRVASPTIITPPTPAAPTNLTGTASFNSVSLQWYDRSINEDGFKVERLAPKGLWTVIATLPAGTASVVKYNDTTALARTTYSYRVGAFINKGGTAYSNTITVTTP
jgi:manganese oxidase